jgi:hypothetical protein
MTVSNDCHFIMSYLKMLVAGFSSLKIFFDLWSGHGGGGVIERGVALGQVLLRMLGFPAINYNYTSAPYSIPDIKTV